MKKQIIAIIVIILVIATIGIIEYFKPKSEEVSLPGTINTTDDRFSDKKKDFVLAKEITTPDGFINTDEINLNDLIGKKVILIDFWTYSCINCQRTMPYLNSWYEKYKDQGLEIIGIHTPEFKFEHEYDNVVEAVERFGIKHPVVLDNDFSTWRAYQNRYWPRKYLIDIDGYVVYDHIGEGGYEETESKIQELLAERQFVLGEEIDIDYSISEPADTERVNNQLRYSPEIYFGVWRNEYLANGRQNTQGTQSFVLPDSIDLNQVYFSGDWGITYEYAENLETEAKIVFKYQAEKVFMVASSEQGVGATILRDGKPLGTVTGADVDDESKVFIQDEQLYRLIEDDEGYGEHLLEIIIHNPGLQAFTFTFG